jgi:hypothetical protein
MSFDMTTRFGGFPIFLIISINLLINTLQMVTATQGFGSVWNKGSWHWENRNYTDFAKGFLSTKWVDISLNANDA